MSDVDAPDSGAGGPAAGALGWAWRAARSAAAGMGIAVGTGTLGLLASAWIASSELLEPARYGNPYNLRVLALDPFAVTLPATQETLEPGGCTLEWVGGYGFLGPTVATTALGARRALTDRTGTPLTAGARTRIRRNLADGTPAKTFGLAYEEVDIPTSLGPMPAWLVPAPAGSPHRDTWAITVHGLGHGRTPVLYLLPELYAGGLTSLTITYRNDVGAPASPDGLYHLGDTEWEDLAAAVEEAERRGARRLILYGESMGGVIVLQFLERADRSGLGGRVEGVVLNSPVLDWGATLTNAGRVRHLPGLLVMAAKEVARRRIGIEWDRLNQLSRAGEVSVPILLIHGDGDTTVPIGPSDALAERRPDLVTYVRVPGAEHVESWKAEPRRCAESLQRFLRSVLTGDDIEPGTPDEPRSASRE